MKKSDFLSYICDVIDNLTYVGYNEEQQKFQFNHGKISFELQSNASSAFLSLNEGKGDIRFSESVALTLNETKNLMEKLIPLSTVNRCSNIRNSSNILDEETISGYLEFLENVLKDPKTLNGLPAYNAGDELGHHFMKFKFKDMETTCFIGKIAKRFQKKEYLLTSIVVIQCFMNAGNVDKTNNFAHDVAIPSWKIKDYPVLDRFIISKIPEDDFSLLFHKIVNTLPHGKELFNDILSHTLPVQNRVLKSPKI